MSFPGKRNLSVWIYPEEVKVQTMKNSLIILRNVSVKYNQSVQIRCSLTRDLMDGYYLKKYKIVFNVITVNYFM